jgi:heat shock protein beta
VQAYDEPVAKTHFSLEGQVEFRALLYVPSVVPFELNKDMFSESSKAVKLYVKRVFINDKFQELLPRWLTFVRGIVDSEDLPLNVGREILQKSKMLSVINKRLVKKSIDMFTDIADKGEVEYMKFWKNFGRYIKVGVLEDDNVKDDLAPLLRFSTTKSGDALKSLGKYVEDMQTNQTDIFYVSGDGKAAAARSPVLEKLRALEIEVVYLTEPLDEMAFQSIGTFKGKRLVDAASADLTALLAASGDEAVAEEAKAQRETAAKDYEEVCEWLQDALKDKDVSKVEVSAKLTNSPAALTQGAYGMSPTMQRYMRAQAVASGQDDMLGSMGQMNQATLEINPTHPIVLKLKALFEASPDAAPTKDFGYLLYDVAALASGYSIDDPAAFAGRVSALMASDAVAVAAAVPAGPSDAEVVDAPKAAAEAAPAAEVEVVAAPPAAATAEPTAVGL